MLLVSYLGSVGVLSVPAAGATTVTSAYIGATSIVTSVFV